LALAGKDVTKLSSKFQISVPKSVRDEHNWKAGQKFAFAPNGKRRSSPGTDT
jgi:AbrB family looped-hinge helix DNA binding protein